MSSHREAPAISQDPVADNADTYAFVSPDDPTTVTIITNYVPLEGPPGGPNFFEFGDDVLYSIFIDNDGDALPDITYQFRFRTTYQNEDTFLYNTGPIGSLTDPNWNKRQLYSVHVIHSHHKREPRAGRARRRCSATTSRARRATSARARRRTTTTSRRPRCITSARNGETVFAGQRNDGFFVDLGAIFDLGDIRRDPEPPPDPDAGGAERRSAEDA